jgi:hypothetical protein
MPGNSVVEGDVCRRLAWYTNHSLPCLTLTVRRCTLCPALCPLLHSVHLLRMDAAGHIRPEFFPHFINQTGLVAWLETGGDVALTAEYEKGAPCPSSRLPLAAWLLLVAPWWQATLPTSRTAACPGARLNKPQLPFLTAALCLRPILHAVRGGAKYNYQSSAMWDPVAACFAGQPIAGTDPDSGCTQVGGWASCWVQLQCWDGQWGRGAPAEWPLDHSPAALPSTWPLLLEQLSIARAQQAAAGVDTRNMAFYCENHDTDRFLSIRYWGRWCQLLPDIPACACMRACVHVRTPICIYEAHSSPQSPTIMPAHHPHTACCRDSLPAYRNALAHTLLSEGIPVVYYGAEQVWCCTACLPFDSTSCSPACTAQRCISPQLLPAHHHSYPPRIQPLPPPLHAVQ